MDDIYERLRARLDDLASGFPETENRIELKILKHLFSEEEAALFLSLSPLLEDPSQIAERLKRDPQEIADILERMATKGLVFRLRSPKGVRYGAVPYVVGIFEFQLNRLNRELVQDMQEYFEKGLGRTFQSFSTPVMRTIPINRELVADWPIAPYEDVLTILDNQKTIAVAPCICRTISKMEEKSCDKPLEACFMFGSHAHYYVENKMGRYITTEEAKEIVRRNEEAGLVMQPFNSQKVGGMCSCCGDCCGMLRSLKKQPAPAKAVQSNYFAEVVVEECVGCEVCLERCQMEAIAFPEEKAVVDPDRCIGCGLCVTTCTTGAMKLIRKPEDQLYKPPQSGAETYLRIAMERGKSLLPQV
jgi:NAD-dependent dihydropyrimidine dehydrogenase PreA subunit/predicted transcriptional regulator